jgi:hypothetical protein
MSETEIKGIKLQSYRFPVPFLGVFDQVDRLILAQDSLRRRYLNRGTAGQREGDDAATQRLGCSRPVAHRARLLKDGLASMSAFHPLQTLEV